MKRLSRRQFAKLAGAAAVTVPVAAATFASPQAAPQQQPAANAPPPLEPRVKLTPEQETRVKQAIERRDRQLAGFRARVLPYELEPAFVFKVTDK
jgi:hypothetical protein